MDRIWRVSGGQSVKSRCSFCVSLYLVLLGVLDGSVSPLKLEVKLR